jgi:heme oxygenase
MVPPRVFGRLDAELRSTNKISDIRWWTLSATASLDAYRNHLIDVYGFEAAVEAAVAYTPGLPVLLDRKPATRSGYVATDLLSLGMSPVEIANLPQYAIAPFGRPAAALGWLYVVERSTRTFPEWHDRLAMQMPMCEAFNYLASHRRDAHIHWERLGDTLDRIVTSDEMAGAVIEAAIEAVRGERAWYRRTQPIAALL